MHQVISQFFNGKLNSAKKFKNIYICIQEYGYETNEAKNLLAVLSGSNT